MSISWKALGKKKEKPLARKRQANEETWKTPNGPHQQMSHARPVNVFQTGVCRQRKLLTPAFNSPADTNDPANVRLRRSHRGPEEEIPDSYVPRAQAPRELSFSKVTKRKREKDRQIFQSRIYERLYCTFGSLEVALKRNSSVIIYSESASIKEAIEKIVKKKLSFTEKLIYQFYLIKYFIHEMSNFNK